MPNQPALQNLNDPIKSVGMANALTATTIKELLKDGTPDWFSHPEDYKEFAREEYLRHKEISDDLASGYRMQDQELLADEAARKVNIISARDFLFTLRSNGVLVGATEIPGEPGIAGMWAKVKGQGTLITTIQVPYMCEWSVLRIDEHGVSAGEKYIGWRTAIAQLILKGAITEKKAHALFGAPTGSVVSRRYRRTLYHYRNR